MKKFTKKLKKIAKFAFIISEGYFSLLRKGDFMKKNLKEKNTKKEVII